jgi:hypothetical protein
MHLEENIEYGVYWDYLAQSRETSSGLFMAIRQ